MPFNFCKFQNYKIDYKRLFNELNAKQIFNHPGIQKEYLYRWMEALEYHDKILIDQFKSRNDIIKYIALTKDESEVFQQPINFEKDEALLHFRVTVAKVIINYHKLSGQKISLKNFQKETGQILWTPVETNVDKYAKSKEPIIVLPYKNGQYNFMVIDGNHRLTYKVKNNIDDVVAISFPVQSVVDFQMFSSTFDEFFYIMLNEFTHMANETHYKKANALDLTQKSYLVDRKFKFDER